MHIRQTVLTLLMFFIFSFLAFGMENPHVIEAKIIDIIAKVISGKKHPKICPDGVNISNLTPYLKYSLPTLFCDKADVIISDSSIPAFDKPFFALDYKTLIENENAVGGLYWLDGRVQLVFIKERLRKFHIKLPENYKKFEVSIKDLQL